MKKIHSVSGLVLSVTLSAAPSAFAQAGQQWRPERPNPGIYASGTEQSAQVLAVNGSVGTGYDTNAQLGANDAGFATLGTPFVSQGSVYNQFSGGLSYSANLDKWSLGASVSSSGRQYPQLDVPVTTGHAASIATSLMVGRRTTIHGGVSATYHSARNFAPFAPLGDPTLGQLASPNLDFAYGNAKYYTHSVDAGIDRQLSRRSTLTGSYSQSGNSYSTLYPDLTSRTGSVRFTRGLTRDLNLRLGYGYTDARYGVGRHFQTHNFDTGVDYNRALSLSRRTKVAFTTGATAVQQSAAVTQERQTRFDVTGSARLTREIGRTWNASLVYQRGVGYAEFMLEPTFSDSVSVAYGGLINRRLAFQSGAGVSRGTVGFHGSANDGFSAANAFAGVSQALTRYLALNVNYSLYRYNFEPGAALVTGLVPRMNRHSVNVALSAWAPVFQHGRKTNASR